MRYLLDSTLNEEKQLDRPSAWNLSAFSIFREIVKKNANPKLALYIYGLGPNTRNRPFAVDNPLIAFRVKGSMTARTVGAQDATDSRVCLDLPNICIFFLSPQIIQ